MQRVLMIVPAFGLGMVLGALLARPGPGDPRQLSRPAGAAPSVRTPGRSAPRVEPCQACLKAAPTTARRPTTAPTALERGTPVRRSRRRRRTTSSPEEVRVGDLIRAFHEAGDRLRWRGRPLESLLDERLSEALENPKARKMLTRYLERLLSGGQWEKARLLRPLAIPLDGTRELNLKLIGAADRDDRALLLECLGRGADPNWDGASWTATYTAGGSARETLEILLSRGGDPRAALCGAVWAEALPNITYLLGRGLSANMRDSDGDPLLFGALDTPLVLRVLLKAGADPNGTNAEGRTALTHALANWSEETWTGLLLLLRAGADINAAGGQALFVAVEDLPVGHLLFLIDHAPRLEVRDEEGNTLLHRAGSLAVARLLLDRGLDPNAANDDGESAVESNSHVAQALKERQRSKE